MSGPGGRKRIRVVSVAAVRRPDGAVLVQRGTDPDDGTPFHRLVGGGVDLMESAADAVVREWQEELGATLTGVRLLAWVENRFTWAGRPAHELVAVHVGEVHDEAVLGGDALPIAGTDGFAHWVPADELLRGPAPLYPDGLAALLEPWVDGSTDD